MQRIRTLGGAAALALVFGLGAPAAAQYGSSPPPPPPPDVPRGNRNAQPAAAATQAEPAEVMRAAVCAVGRDANASIALLATQPRSSDERNRATAVMRTVQRCPNNARSVATTPMLLRAAIAETLYETQFTTPVAARTPPLAAAALPRPTPGSDAFLTALAPMYALADCATPRAPDLVRAMLATEPRSAEQATAMNALTPALAACVPAGSQIGIDPRYMRGFFAEALYRWSVVQRDGPAAPYAAPAAAPAPAGN